MRRIIIAIGTTLSGLVLLFSWPTSTNQAVSGSSGSGSGAGTTASGGTTTADGSTTTGVSATFTGDAASTRYGDVQVQITVTDGVVTAADAIDHPSGGRNDQINNYAVPILNDETLAAQGSNIDMVSGATFTSRGYVESLQSALDQAGL